MLLTISLAAPAHAGCYVDYKAKKDDPLKLHYGVMELSNGCDIAQNKKDIQDRLKNAGWTLLTVLSNFNDDDLEGKKANAGLYFLRF